MSAAAINSALLAPGLSQTAPTRPITGATTPANAPSFAELLTSATQTSPPHFSRHALDRLQQRGIDLTPQTVQRLSNGIAQAASKGSRDSVVFVDGTAFVTSVKNNTVITAVSPEHMREHVFTNIDSAVFA